MNYRHAFHAGNFADVLKHVLLSRILVYLAQKPAPFRFIDSHAGIGRYDLSASDASRTGEWREGIGRLDAASAPAAVADLLRPYLDAVGPRDAFGMPTSYPGSPALAQHLLRAGDRMTFNELHPDDARTLEHVTGGDRRVTLRRMDGYAALRASLPPPERRGLVLIDPAYEDRAEFDHLLRGFAESYRRWPTGIYALWYPLKPNNPAAQFLADLRAMGLPKVLEAELFVPQPAATGGLAGSGLVVVNPPYTLRAEADVLLPYLAACLGTPVSAWHWRLAGTDA